MAIKLCCISVMWNISHNKTFETQLQLASTLSLSPLLPHPLISLSCLSTQSQKPN